MPTAQKGEPHPPARSATSSSSASVRPCSAAACAACAELRQQWGGGQGASSLPAVKGSETAAAAATTHWPVATRAAATAGPKPRAESRASSSACPGRAATAQHPPQPLLQVGHPLLQHLAAAGRRRLRLPLQLGLCVVVGQARRSRGGRCLSSCAAQLAAATTTCSARRRASRHTGGANHPPGTRACPRFKQDRIGHAPAACRRCERPSTSCSRAKQRSSAACSRALRSSTARCGREGWAGWPGACR